MGKGGNGTRRFLVFLDRLISSRGRGGGGGDIPRNLCWGVGLDAPNP